MIVLPLQMTWINVFIPDICCQPDRGDDVRCWSVWSDVMQQCSECNTLLIVHQLSLSEKVIVQYLKILQHRVYTVSINKKNPSTASIFYICSINYWTTVNNQVKTFSANLLVVNLVSVTLMCKVVRALSLCSKTEFTQRWWQETTLLKGKSVGT